MIETPSNHVSIDRGQTMYVDDFSDIVRRQQRQDSLTEQLADLIDVATLLGMYDAADWIKTMIAAPLPRKDNQDD